MDLLGTTFDDLLARGAAYALAGSALWSVLVVVGVVLEACTDGHIRLAHRLGCPAHVRLRLLALTVALLTGASPAMAGDRPSPGRPGAVSTLDGLPLPDRPSAAPTSATRAHQPARRAPRYVVVAPGDSLWRIARRILPAGAAEVDVAAAVDALHAHNRRTIGPDPDLIRPGQRLGVPAGLPADFPSPDPTTLSEAP